MIAYPIPLPGIPAPLPRGAPGGTPEQAQVDEVFSALLRMLSNATALPGERVPSTPAQASTMPAEIPRPVSGEAIPFGTDPTSWLVILPAAETAAPVEPSDTPADAGSRVTEQAHPCDADMAPWLVLPPTSPTPVSCPTAEAAEEAEGVLAQPIAAPSGAQHALPTTRAMSHSPVGPADVAAGPKPAQQAHAPVDADNQATLTQPLAKPSPTKSLEGMLPIDSSQNDPAPDLQITVKSGRPAIPAPAAASGATQMPERPGPVSGLRGPDPTSVAPAAKAMSGETGVSSAEPPAVNVPNATSGASETAQTENTRVPIPRPQAPDQASVVLSGRPEGSQASPDVPQLHDAGGPVPIERFAERIVTHARLAAGDGSGQLDIQLHPLHLGRVSISLSVQGHEVTLSLTADNAAAQQLMTSRLPELALALEQAGMALSQANVSVNDQGRGRTDHPEHDGRGRPTRGESVPAEASMEWSWPSLHALDISA